MKWFSKAPVESQQRIVTKFLWRPKEINGETRWLEFASWIEEFGYRFQLEARKRINEMRSRGDSDTPSPPPRAATITGAEWHPLHWCGQSRSVGGKQEPKNIIEKTKDSTGSRMERLVEPFRQNKRFAWIAGLWALGWGWTSVSGHGWLWGTVAFFGAPLCAAAIIVPVLRWMERGEDQNGNQLYETEEYQAFVASMVPHCHCRANNCPCDGVLAGGPCDMVQEEEPWRSYDDDE